MWSITMFSEEVFVRISLRPSGAKCQSEAGIPSVPKPVRSKLNFPGKPILSSMGTLSDKCRTNAAWTFDKNAAPDPHAPIFRRAGFSAPDQE